MDSTAPAFSDSALGSFLAGIALEQGLCRPSEVVDAVCLGQELRSFGVPSDRLVRILLERGSISTDGVSRLLCVAEAEIRGLWIPGLGDLTLVRRDRTTLLFRGVEEESGRDVHVRMLRLTLSEFRGFIDRFVLARRRLERLGAEGVGFYLRGGDVEGVPYAVFEWAPGPDLASRVRDSGVLPGPAAREVLRRLAEDLRRAHGLGIVHGGLSPSEVFLSASGTARLGEFPLLDGSARHAEALLPYLAPEAGEAADEPSVPGDVYGLAAVVVHALTGGAPDPNRGRHPGSGEEAPVPGGLLPGVLLRMLDPAPDRRPASMEEVLDLIGDGEPEGVPSPARIEAPPDR
jgi:serine/threonine protein kinase